MPGVVEHLHLRTGEVGLIALLGHPIEDAAVSARLHLPLERQLEVAELIGGNDVAALPDACERAIHDAPSGGHIGPLVPAPSRGRGTIEQRAPLTRAPVSCLRRHGRLLRPAARVSRGRLSRCGGACGNAYGSYHPCSKHRSSPIEVVKVVEVVEVIEDCARAGGHLDTLDILDDLDHLGQCLNCRCPVNTIAIPCSSAAAITSASRTEPPGWTMAVMPASAACSTPSRNGKNASEPSTAPD